MRAASTRLRSAISSCLAEEAAEEEAEEAGSEGRSLVAEDLRALLSRLSACGAKAAVQAPEVPVGEACEEDPPEASTTASAASRAA